MECLNYNTFLKFIFKKRYFEVGQYLPFLMEVPNVLCFVTSTEASITHIVFMMIAKNLNEIISFNLRTLYNSISDYWYNDELRYEALKPVNDKQMNCLLKDTNIFYKCAWLKIRSYFHIIKVFCFKWWNPWLMYYWVKN